MDEIKRVFLPWCVFQVNPDTEETLSGEMEEIARQRIHQHVLDGKKKNVLFPF